MLTGLKTHINMGGHVGKLIAFPKAENPPKTLVKFVQITHELAKKSENVYLDHPHAKERMAERNISIQQIFEENMTDSTYHYTECGLNNIYLLNGYKFHNTPRGKSISIKDIDGLHRAIGLFLVTTKRDLTGDEVRFLRLGMLMSQSTLAKLLGISDQAVRRWENGKVTIPKPSESLLRLLYREHVKDKDGKISKVLKEIADLEEMLNDKKIHFKDTRKGWQSAA